jgi:hypothetical protein
VVAVVVPSVSRSRKATVIAEALAASRIKQSDRRNVGLGNVQIQPIKCYCSESCTPSLLVGGCWVDKDGTADTCSSLSLEAATCRTPAGVEDVAGLTDPGGTCGSPSAPLASASGCSGSLSSAAANESSLDARSAIANMANSEAGGSSPR